MRHVLSRLGPVVVGTVCVLVVVASATGNSPPPGATALCRDGTYSFSTHRSGTCSYHGGVAKWLSGSTSASIQLGSTILLAPRTRTTACTLGANPDRRCSPGAFYSKLTKPVLCSTTFRTGSIRNVPDLERFAVEQEYGLAPGRYGTALEIDHIVSLELGGSNAIANLFPEKANADPGYRVKDRLENRLHDLVCEGRLGLRRTQREIASNWQVLYKRVFGVAPSA